MRKWILLCIVVAVFIGACTEDFPDCPIQGFPSDADHIGPAKVTDLTGASFSDSTVVLAWTASGDDGIEGRASYYDIRYSLSPAALQEWSIFCLLGPELTPGVSGQAEMATISNLNPNTEYFFALRTADEDSNWSPVSNVLAARTSCRTIFESPVAGENYCQGDTMIVVWSVGDCMSETVSPLLLADGNIRAYLARNVENTGQFIWEVDAHGSLNMDYSIVIAQPGELEYQSRTEIFSISESCSIELESPNGGEVFCRGESERVLWNRSSCCSYPVLVELLHNYAVIDTLEGVNYSGAYWTVESPVSEEDGYRLKVTNLETGISDVSEYSFRITGPDSPTLLFPSGGAVLQEYEEVGILWNPGSCLTGQVKIELQYEDEVILTISEMTPDDGEFYWMPISDGDSAHGYKIVVTNLDSGFSGTSLGSFSIERVCRINYLTPLEGASFCLHDPMEITWDSSRWCGETVSIGILQGTHFIHITGEIPNTGSWQGTAPSLYFSGGSRIKITETESGYYTIGPYINLFPQCSVSLNYPNGGESFVVGEEVSINWDAEVCCGSNLRIELLKDGSLCQVITESASNSSEQFSWVVNDCEEGGGNYSIRIEESQFEYSDISESTFAIERECRLSITEPIDGQVFYSGDSVPIIWNSTSFCSEEVVIEMKDADGLVLYGPFTVQNNESWQFTPQDLPGGINSYSLWVYDSETGEISASREIEFRVSPYLVQPDGTGDFPTIRSAVVAARDGDEILLGDGIFQGNGLNNVYINNNAEYSIASQSGDPRSCIINCNGGFGFKIYGVTAGLQISGITLKNGGGVRNYYKYGGAVHIRRSTVRFNNCIFEHNVIDYNNHGLGGAAFLDYSNVEFVGCVFRANAVMVAGGGMGAAIHCQSSLVGSSSYLSLENCTFAENGNAGSSVLSIIGNTDLLMVRTIISNNTGTAIGFGGVTADISCSDIYLNAEDGWPDSLSEWGSGFQNFSLDPLFCDLGNGNVAVDSNSACSAAYSPCGALVGAGHDGCQ